MEKTGMLGEINTYLSLYFSVALFLFISLEFFFYYLKSNILKCFESFHTQFPENWYEYLKFERLSAECARGHIYIYFFFFFPLTEDYSFS